MAFATPEDIATRAERDLTAIEAGTVTSLLDWASALILDEASGSSAAWVTNPDVNAAPEAVQSVCVEVAFRAFANPEALSSERVGDVSASNVGRTTNIPDSLFLTAREKRLVRRAAAVSAFQSVTLASPYSGDDEPVDDPIIL